MLEERIKSLLDSELEVDNLLGWELIEAKQVPFKDVIDYVENSKVPTMWEKRYRWNGDKFVRNYTAKMNIGTNYGGYITSTGDFNYPPTVGYSTVDVFNQSTHFKASNINEIQKEKGVDKPRGIWQNIKSAFKSK